LRESILELVGSDKVLPNAKKIGIHLRKLRGKVKDGMKFTNEFNDHDNAQKWRLRRL
jgi:hypothetical protein